MATSKVMLFNFHLTREEPKRVNRLQGHDDSGKVVVPGHLTLSLSSIRNIL